MILPPLVFNRLCLSEKLLSVYRQTIGLWRNLFLCRQTEAIHLIHVSYFMIPGVSEEESL